MKNEYIAQKIAKINAALRDIYREDKALVSLLAKAMNYSLQAGGKRLRPLMLMAAADTVGDNSEKYLHIACALEMIHTYSLIHDDLPAMDNDDYRRGKLTNHKVFGDATAILAGDALLTMAFSVIDATKGVSPSILIRVNYEISHAAGPEGMVGGQVLDLLAENKKIGLPELQKLHCAKTGALFCAAVRSGGILAGAREKELAALTAYAQEFGLAFQITDDILDVIGDKNKLGKTVGSDEKNNKSTYVSLFSLDKAKIMAKQAVDNAIDALSIFDEKAVILRNLAKNLLDRQQ